MRHQLFRLATGLAAAAVLALPTTDAHAQTIRVPQQANLQQALNRVANGGVVEISGGTYASPDRGFRINLQSRSFTVRAAAGAQVVLDGGGENEVFRIEGGNGSAGSTIRFERLRFVNGLSDQATLAGGLTVARGTAVVEGCTFRNNRADAAGTGGGAILVSQNAILEVRDTLFADNSAFLRGGAVSFLGTTGIIERSRFLRNRVNLAPHAPNSAGGAIYGLDGRVTIRRSHFEDNESGFAGGAVYMFGTWQEPLSQPAGEVDIFDSTFVGNRVFGDPCCAIDARTFGGGLHVEDHVTARVRGSLFRFNEAVAGGAMDTYRAILDVEDTVFQGNRGVTVGTRGGLGGAVQVTSADFADPSTEDGAVNRRPGELHARHTLFQGRFQGVGTTANQGGCLQAGGDGPRVFGGAGIAPDGSLASNRARVTLTDTVFFDCDTAAVGGGGVFARIVDLVVRRSLFLDSDSPTTGGGLSAAGFNRVVLDDVTFADNTAGNNGGGAALIGSNVTVANSRFFRNRTQNGAATNVTSSRGAALFVGPDFGNQGQQDVTGVVRDTLFTANQGLAIFDAARNTGAANRVRYNGNDFRETSYGTRVYRHALAGGTGETVAGLNRLVIGGIDKSTVANVQLGAAPRVGRVVSAPSAIPEASPPDSGIPQRRAFLGYAWTGPSARLAGANLPDRTGLLPVAEAGVYTLTVAGAEADTATVAGEGCGGGRTLCLGGDRFEVEVDFRDFADNTGEGQVVPLSTDDSGLFFFFDEDNWEILVKVLNGCPINGNIWVFSAAVTNVEYTLTVRDTATGQVTRYTNPLGTAAPAITDTSALQGCDAGQPMPADAPTAMSADDSFGSTWVSETLRDLGTELAPDLGQAGCVADGETLCLNRNRFRVEVDFEDFSGNRGIGRAVPVSTDDSGLFFFFDEDNWEILVKVLNGCPINNRYWVFSAATTTVQYTLRVTDTETGLTQSYRNPLGRSADAVTDTDAFATCP